MILTNGFPKCGNHALVKGVQLLGQPCSVHHITPEMGIPEETTKHLFIVRNPRNALISWIRYQASPVTVGMFLTYLQKWDTASYKSEWDKYEGLLSNPSIFIVKFEELIASDLVLRNIAEYLEVPYLEDAFPALPGLTATWTGKLSDYRDIWCETLESAWVDSGMAKVQAKWGY